MSIVCLVILVPTVRDFFFKLVLFTTLNSSQTAGLLLLCDHRIFFVIGPMVTTAAYGSIKSGDTYFQLKCTWRLLIKSLKILRLLKLLLIVGWQLLRWRFKYLYFVEKVGLPCSWWRRLDSVQNPSEGLSWMRLSVSTATPEKLRRWHGTTFSRYSLVHS